MFALVTQVWDRITAASKQQHRPVVAELIKSLAGMVPSLLQSMHCHKEIPSLQYYGLLNLRLLFRLPFFKPNQLEELLSEAGMVEGEEVLGDLGGNGSTASISGGPSVLGTYMYRLAFLMGFNRFCQLPMLDLDGSLSMLSISEWRGAQVSEAGGVYTRERHRSSCRELLAEVIPSHIYPEVSVQ